MISSAPLAFILIFLVLRQGVTAAVSGAVCYAVLSRIPAAGWMKAGICLASAIAGAAIFALTGNVTGTGPLYMVAAFFLIFPGPLVILSPLFILAEREEYAPYAGYPAIMATLFCAAATGGLIEALNITAFLRAGNDIFSPAAMHLLSFVIMAGIQVVLSAEFFMLAGAVQQRREEQRDETVTE